MFGERKKSEFVIKVEKRRQYDEDSKWRNNLFEKRAEYLQGVKNLGLPGLDLDPTAAYEEVTGVVNVGGFYIQKKDLEEYFKKQAITEKNNRKDIEAKHEQMPSGGLLQKIKESLATKLLGRSVPVISPESRMEQVVTRNQISQAQAGFIQDLDLELKQKVKTETNEFRQKQLLYILNVLSRSSGFQNYIQSVQENKRKAISGFTTEQLTKLNQSRESLHQQNSEQNQKLSLEEISQYALAQIATLAKSVINYNQGIDNSGNVKYLDQVIYKQGRLTEFQAEYATKFDVQTNNNKVVSVFRVLAEIYGKEKFQSLAANLFELELRRYSSVDVEQESLTPPVIDSDLLAAAREIITTAADPVQKPASQTESINRQVDTQPKAA